MGYFLLKYWNKPFVLEIYIRVTKNCIYTIKIGYGLTLTQKSYVKSPLGFLSFQTDYINVENSLYLFQSPLGFLHFQTNNYRLNIVFPKGFNPLWGFCTSKLLIHRLESFLLKSFNPLWGFCSSKQHLCNPSIYAG